LTWVPAAGCRRLLPDVGWRWFLAVLQSHACR